MMAETLTKKESIIWASGFFNADGFIRYYIKCKLCGLATCKEMKKPYIYYNIGINNKNIESLEAFQTIFDGRVVQRIIENVPYNRWYSINMIHTRRVLRHIFP